VMADVTCA